MTQTVAPADARPDTLTFVVDQARAAVLAERAVLQAWMLDSAGVSLRPTRMVAQTRPKPTEALLLRSQKMRSTLDSLNQPAFDGSPVRTSKLPPLAWLAPLVSA